MADLKSTVNIRKLAESDRPWVKALWVEHWGGDFMVTRGKIHRLDGLDGFVFEIDGKKLGLITFRIDNDEIEITSLNSLDEGKGIGTALVKMVLVLAPALFVKRVMLITTNDNTKALRFWQKRGFSLAEVYPGVVEESRKLKPTIPLIGNDGIPIRDEIELEMLL